MCILVKCLQFSASCFLPSVSATLSFSFLSTSVHLFMCSYVFLEVSCKIITTLDLPTYYLHYFTHDSLIQSFLHSPVVIVFVVRVFYKFTCFFFARLLLSEFNIVSAAIFASFQVFKATYVSFFICNLHMPTLLHYPTVSCVKTNETFYNLNIILFVHTLVLVSS